MLRRHKVKRISLDILLVLSSDILLGVSFSLSPLTYIRVLEDRLVGPVTYTDLQSPCQN